jgi:hypothetical protein
MGATFAPRPGATLLLTKDLRPAAAAARRQVRDRDEVCFLSLQISRVLRNAFVGI